MNEITTTLIIIGIIFAAIAILALVIRFALNRTTKKYLGMNLEETSKMIRKGLKEEPLTPRSVANMTPVYKPQLLRDFPETSYDQIESMAKNALIGFLTAITAQDTGKLFAPSRNLTKQAQNRIDSSAMSGKPEKFENIKIHKMSMANYKSANGVADATFEIAFQALHGGTDPEQFACSLILNSGRAEADDSSSAVFSLNCPNCGGPLRIAGKNSVCPYCGTGVSERGTRVWLADSVKFI